jgi:RNA polymerase sigma-70 factor (ECF subfamily)
MEAHMENEQHFEIRVGQKDTREMQDVLTRYMPSFYRRAYLQLGNTADAEDAVQDALLSAYKHLDQFKGQAQLSTWLTAIVTNSARMQLRRRPRHKHLSLDEPLGEEQEYCLAERLTDYAPTPEEECRKSELHGRLMHFLKELSPSLRKVFQLRELDGLSTKEAAQVMGVADGTVKAQLARARTKLTKLMRRALDGRPRSALSSAALSVTAVE